MHLSYLLIQLRGKDKIVECFVVSMEDLVARTFPLLLAAFEEDNIVAHLHDGVHVMGVDNGADVILLRNVLYEFVDYE